MFASPRLSVYGETTSFCGTYFGFDKALFARTLFPLLWYLWFLFITHAVQEPLQWIPLFISILCRTHPSRDGMCFIKTIGVRQTRSHHMTSSASKTSALGVKWCDVGQPRLDSGYNPPSFWGGWKGAPRRHFKKNIRIGTGNDDLRNDVCIAGIWVLKCKGCSNINICHCDDMLSIYNPRTISSWNWKEFMQRRCCQRRCIWRIHFVFQIWINLLWNYEEPSAQLLNWSTILLSMFTCLDDCFSECLRQRSVGAPSRKRKENWGTWNINLYCSGPPPENGLDRSENCNGR